MTKEYLYEADLDDAKFLAALNRMDKAAQDLAGRAGRALSNISAQPTGRADGDAAGAGVRAEASRDDSSRRRVEQETQAQAEINLLRRNELNTLQELASRRIALGAAAVTAANKQERDILREAVRAQTVILGEAKRADQARRQLAQQSAQATTQAARNTAAQRVETESRADATIALLRRNNARTLEEIAQRQINIGRVAVEARTRQERIILAEAVQVKRAEINLERQASREIVQLARQRQAQQAQLLRQQSRAEREAARTAQQEAQQVGRLRASNIAKLTVAYNLLAQAVIAAGRRVAQFFASMVQESVRAATGLESVETSFGAVFGRGSEAALATITLVREESKRLGIDLSQITRRILPLVESVEQAVKVGELAASLARLDPLQGETGAITALNEALAGGDLRSLRLRFEIPTDDIINAQNQLGDVEGLIQGLGKVLKDRGVDFSQLAGTFDVTASIMKQRLQFLREEFGRPIIDKLNEEIQKFNEFIAENEDDIILIVDALGRLVANAIELGAQVLGVDEFFASFDSDATLDQIVRLEKILALVQGLVEVAKQGSIGQFNTEVSELVDRFFDLETALESLIKLISFANANFAVFGLEISAVGDALSALADGDIAAIKDAVRELGKISVDRDLLRQLRAGEINKETFDALQQGTAVAEVYNAEIQRGVGVLEAATAAEKAAADAITERAEAMEAANQVTTDSANVLLALRNANNDIADAQAELAEAQEEVGEKMAEANRDFQRSVMDAQVEAERDRLDLERESAEKRVDLARENAQEIADIIRKNNQRVADAYRDLQRREQEILRRHTNRVGEIEQESANNRVDIEEDFRRQLEDIRRRFDFEAEEAVRQNDAVALLRIRRRMRFELEEAANNRDERVADEELDRERAIEAERERLQQQLEEARIANEERLEDLRISLQREFEEQAIAHERELEELRISEERKRQELELSHQRQLEDLQTALKRRLEDLQAELADEELALQEAEDAKLAIMEASNASLQQIMDARVAIMQQAANRMRAIALETARLSLNPGTGGNTLERNTPGDPNIGNAPPGSFDDLPNPYQPPLPSTPPPPPNPNAGTPADPNSGNAPNTNAGGLGLQDGTVSPAELARLFFAPPSSAAPAVSNVNNSRNAEVSLSMLDPTKVTPTQAAIMRNIALETIREAIR